MAEYKERNVVFGTTEFPLGGTLTVPEGAGRSPAVVFVHGSGPNDRDESVAMNRPFRDIARGLAERGIASLRYDKRTLAHAERVAAQISELTVYGEVIEDAVLAKAFLAERDEVDAERIFLLGHSFGGMLAPRIDAEGGDFRGLVLLAGSPRRLAEIIRDQNYAQLPTVEEERREAVRKQIDALFEMFEAFAEAEDGDLKQIDIGGASAYYMKELDSRRAETYLAASGKPVFALQGEADFQVYADRDFAEYQRILGSRANATLKLYPGLNHLFMPGVNGDVTDYEIPGSVDAGVISDIADWILAN
ncbi:MAG: alpha/beta fold hydrolase [Oscillospiraceae bacterium]|jgi:dienelactone hydrolase|nr:alpha/beta fold hydrolase [Oscillospiraceae bacterium]